MRSQLADLFSSQTENEDVIVAYLLPDLNVSAVHRTDDECAIESEFHVARSGGFGPGCRDLFRELGSREDPLRQRDAVVGEEHYPQQCPDILIAVDRVPNRIDELDDQFRHEISGCSLAGEDNCARNMFAVRVVLNPVIQRDCMKRVEQLSLVFVDPLNLAVEERVRVNGDHLASAPILFFDDLKELQLVVAFRGAPSFTERGIRGSTGQSFKLEQVGYPALADGLGDEAGKFWIGRF